MRYKLDELHINKELFNILGEMQERIQIFHKSKLLFTAFSKQEAENWLRQNCELPADKYLPTTAMSEAIARALTAKTS